jgi:hypothetical protein
MNSSFGFYQNKLKTIKKLLKFDFKAKKCSANYGCYEPIRGGEEQRVPLQNATQFCMEWLGQNAEITKKTTCAQIEILRCCVLNSQEA